MPPVYNRERLGKCPKGRPILAPLGLRHEKKPAESRRQTRLDRLTIADVACYSYTVFAREGGISLKPFPAVGAWLTRIQALPRYLPPPEYDGAGGPLVE